MSISISISNSQRMHTQVLDDCNEDIAQFFLKNYAIHVKPASGANFFRKLAQVSRAQQRIVEQWLRHSPLQWLASTHHSTLEIMTRSKESPPHAAGCAIAESAGTRTAAFTWQSDRHYSSTLV